VDAKEASVLIELLNMDCMEYMKGCEDNSFDLAIVDPPYGIGADNFKNGEGSNAQVGQATAPTLKKNRLNAGSGKLKNRLLNQSDCSWDTAPTKEYFDELFRASKNQIIFGGNYFDLPPTRGVICWDKQQPWENFSAWEMGWSSFDVPASIFRYRNNGFSDNQSTRIHPTQKPVKLYKWLLEKYANDGDRVIDTHLGSGSSAIAAHYFGCDFVGMEIDEDYYKAAVERFNNETKQVAMF